MAKDGYGFLTGVFLFFILMLAGAIISRNFLLEILALISFVFLLFSFYFFRDPERQTPAMENAIISPADGKIIVIDEVNEPDYFKGRVKKVSIFMSVTDVHVNRIPVSGKVNYFNYKKGSFLPAYHEDASLQNEHTSIGIENEKMKILFRQIAGILARRIVCHIREGNKVTRGERFGMIKFGSRVDIFVPLHVEIKVKLNDKVKAGETIIGIY
ncbi:phosphatidylserine decarboxylase [candidate division KSB1 bacterium 4484_87]|nr:MAG: phosphatidylserine decarboxylase [candidate division KSB1 bacterium 4484_87]